MHELLVYMRKMFKIGRKWKIAVKNSWERVILLRQLIEWTKYIEPFDYNINSRVLSRFPLYCNWKRLLFDVNLAMRTECRIIILTTFCLSAPRMITGHPKGMALQNSRFSLLPLVATPSSSSCKYLPETFLKSLLILTTFCNFCFKFEEHLPISCFLYKKFLRFWKRSIPVS